MNLRLMNNSFNCFDVLVISYNLIRHRFAIG